MTEREAVFLTHLQSAQQALKFAAEMALIEPAGPIDSAWEAVESLLEDTAILVEAFDNAATGGDGKFLEQIHKNARRAREAG